MACGKSAGTAKGRAQGRKGSDARGPGDRAETGMRQMAESAVQESDRTKSPKGIGVDPEVWGNTGW